MLGLPLEVLDPPSVIDFAGRAWDFREGVDFLVNNAAVQPTLSPLASLSRDAASAQIAASYLGPLQLAQCLVGRLDGRPLSIVNVSSAVALEGASYLAHYAAGKAALENVTRSMAKEWASLNVRANVVTLGPFDTEFLRVARCGCAKLSRNKRPLLLCRGG